jgi:hypothetical protein
MRLSSRADTIADAAPDPTATAMDRGPFDDGPTVEDAAIEDPDLPIDPPTAKHHLIWLEDISDKTPKPTRIWG